MPPILVLLAIIWLVLSIVFGYFYAQETRKMVIAGLIVVIILLLWFLGPVVLRVP